MSNWHKVCQEGLLRWRREVVTSPNIKYVTVFRQGQRLLDQGCPNFDKHFWVLQYMKKLRSSSLEHFLVIRVCQKCQKYENSEKPGFWGNCGYISKTVWSIFMIFWHKTALNHKQKNVKKNFKFFSIFWENVNCAKIEISQKPVFLFLWNSKLKEPKAYIFRPLKLSI